LQKPKIDKAGHKIEILIICIIYLIINLNSIKIIQF
jgi:hypothetical protein